MKFCRFGLWMFLFIASAIIIPGLSASAPVKKFVPILCYHRVTPTIKSIYDLTPEMLEEHFQFFKKNGYHPITALQYLKFQRHLESLPSNPIVLTFDDGNKDHYQYVFPLLQQYGFQATFFVYPSLVFEKSDYFITWDELSEMVRAGMDIESHTFSHPFLTRTITRPDNPHYLQWLDHELKDSKNILEQKLKIKVELLAYPYGWYNCVIEAKAVQADYQGMFTVNWGTNLPAENPLRLKRRPISNNFTLFQMQQYLSSKPLSLEVISPEDASIISEKPEIQFKLEDPKLHRVDIIVDKYKGDLTPDDRGVFTFTKFKTLYSGYYMIIVSGYDDNDQFYINTWGFDYQKPAEDPDKSTSEIKSDLKN